MPYRCCVPKCRGNYDASGPKVAVFGFPQNPELRTQWLQLIKREHFVPTKASKVCRTMDIVLARIERKYYYF